MKEKKLIVYKFGGASVNSATAVKNVKHILDDHNKKLVVISAMGKTTNKLEKIVNDYYSHHIFNEEVFNELMQYHLNIVDELIEEQDSAFRTSVEKRFYDLKTNVLNLKTDNYDFFYDSIVSFGEKIGTYIISKYLVSEKINCLLLDSTKTIRTDDNYRDANVDFSTTGNIINKEVVPLFNKYDIIIAQGFIAGTKDGNPTTLGREGSDYSAAIFAYCLNAKSMTVWKDVAGMMSADPKRMKDAVKIISLPYNEAIELSYYGASIIHPKTIKPLENLQIPLYVRSFLNPNEKGTSICNITSVNPIVPNYIFKDNQMLLSITPKNFSFATESNISEIFSILAKNKVKVNLMQNSAISFSICMNENKTILDSLLEELDKNFRVSYNTDLQLITIRHYTMDSIKKIIYGKRIIIEQKSRITAQYLINTKKE